VSAVAASGTPDLGRLLGLTGVGAKVLLGLYWLTFLSLALFSGGAPMQTVEGWVALALVLTSATALVLPWSYPLPWPLVGGLLAVTAFTTVAICWHLDPSEPPLYTSWNFGAITFLMYMVALRGRVLGATAGMLLMAALTVHWTFATSGDLLHGVDLVYRQFFSFLAVCLFALWLRRTARRIAEFRTAQRERVATEQATAASDDERRRQLARVRKLTGPALRAIAEERADAAQRFEHGLIEAEVRDSIRGRALARGGIPEAARAARVRGVSVSIIDDLRGDPPEDLLIEALGWATERLARTASGEVTLRLALADGRPVLTFATADGGPEMFSLRAG